MKNNKTISFESSITIIIPTIITIFIIIYLFIYLFILFYHYYPVHQTM